jgi:hypothetical protein
MDTDQKTQNGNDECCCGSPARNDIKYRPVPSEGIVPSASGDIVKVSTKWDLMDYIWAIAVRFDINRMNYAVSPGIYAVGNPDKESPVLVSCNYKLSFDVLREQLEGLNVWVLVIDTKGVNVWCAAGKGSFGTMEIVKRVLAVNLDKIVTTRKLIVPQLGAPGVAAHIVSAFSGFNVIYGPVRAKDIKQFLTNGMKTDASMRKVTFNVVERLQVSWLELANALKAGFLISFAALIIYGLNSKGYSFQTAWERSALIILLAWVSIFTGTILTAVLLPFIPVKAFSLKGGLLGGIAAGGIILILGKPFSFPAVLSLLLFSSALAGYLSLNYTGCSTYTSLSGVKKEIQYALPVIIGMIVLAVILQLIKGVL